MFSVHQRPQWFQQRPVVVKIVDVLDETWFEVVRTYALVRGSDETTLH